MFEMVIVHVNESAASIGTDASAEWAAHGQRLDASLKQTNQTMTTVALEDVFDCCDSPDSRRLRLSKLMASVSDPTARQDVVGHLRTALLLKTASTLNCNKVTLGHSATSLASAFIAASAKVRSHPPKGFVEAAASVSSTRTLCSPNTKNNIHRINVPHTYLIGL